MYLNRSCFISVAAALLFAGTAHASALKYTLTGQIDLNLAGVAFDDVTLTLTGLSDPNESGMAGSRITFPLSSLTAAVLGFGTFPAPTNIAFFYYATNSTGAGKAGFYDTSTGEEVLLFDSPFFKGYDGSSTFGVTPVAFDQAQGIDTPFGRAIILDARNLAISATTGTVPEPGSWALMLVGFGAIGAGLRARRTSITFAGLPGSAT